MIDGRRHENMEDSREADSQEGDDASSVLAFLAGVTVAASGNEIWCACMWCGVSVCVVCVYAHALMPSCCFHVSACACAKEYACLGAKAY